MIEYAIDKVNRLTRVWMSGCNSSADLARHYSTVLDDPNYDPAFDTIFHVAGDAGGPILAEVPETGRLLEALALLQNRRKWAVVMRPGFKRTIVEFLLTGVKLGSVHMRFFDDDLQALAWLDQERNSPVTRQGR
jgi:hypothetical protein